ncbi:hypothetical protein [Serratia fonticola]|uniref:hypothetical protein n=1 Tax=Serratia fonticola TaxID=47917 RepID=UPI001268EB9A|nr:hypothetical protein [Serratia fonticola]
MTQTRSATPVVTLENIDWDNGYNGFVSLMMQQGFSPDKSFIAAAAFTRLCYGYARKFSQDYQGDFWCWYTQSDEGFSSVRRLRKSTGLRFIRTTTVVR